MYRRQQHGSLKRSQFHLSQFFSTAILAQNVCYCLMRERHAYSATNSITKLRLQKVFFLRKEGITAIVTNNPESLFPCRYAFECSTRDLFSVGWCTILYNCKSYSFAKLMSFSYWERVCSRCKYRHKTRLFAYTNLFLGTCTLKHEPKLFNPHVEVRATRLIWLSLLFCFLNNWKQNTNSVSKVMLSMEATTDIKELLFRGLRAV